MTLKEKYQIVLNALFEYADPDTYAAISYLADHPCGAFVDDFDENHDMMWFYQRPMPGATARKALREVGLLDDFTEDMGVDTK